MQSGAFHGPGFIYFLTTFQNFGIWALDLNSTVQLLSASKVIKELVELSQFSVVDIYSLG